MTDPTPGGLYAAMIAQPMVATLNADRKPTKREELLELFQIALSLEGNNGELRFPRTLILQADDARRAGRRPEVSFHEPTQEFVVTLTPTAPEQGQLPGHGSGRSPGQLGT